MVQMDSAEREPPTQQNPTRSLKSILTEKNTHAQ